MSRLVAVAANTFRETVRERVLYNLVFFAVLMTVAGLLLEQVSIYQDEKIIKDIGLASIDLFGTAIALFIGVGLVSKEIERRSLYPLLAKPLSRDEFYLGKFLGLAFTLGVNVSVMTLGICATLWATRGKIGLELLGAVFPSYLALLVVVAVAMLLSSITSSTLAAVGTLGVLIAGHNSDVIRNMRQVAPDVPPWLIEVLYLVVPNLRNFDFKARVVYGEVVSPAALGWVTLYALAYLLVLLSLGVASFRRREMQ